MEHAESSRPAATSGRWIVLWRLIRPRFGLLAAAVVLGLVASAMELAIPLVTQRILDSLGAPTALLQPVGLLFASLVVAAVFNWWQWVLIRRLAEDIVYDARERMIRGLVRARLLPLLRFPTGELVTRVTSDSVLLWEAASSSAIGLINGSVAIFGALVLMGVLDPVLLAVTLGALVIVAAGTAMHMPAIAGMQERALASLGDLYRRMVQTLSLPSCRADLDREFEREAHVCGLAPSFRRRFPGPSTMTLAAARCGIWRARFE